MRKFFLFLLLAFCLQFQPIDAQNHEFKNAIHAKVNFIDYGAIAGENVGLGEGFEFGYLRNIAPFLNVGIPFKLGLAKIPSISGNTVASSLDVIFHLENMRSESKIVPYAFAGAGYCLKDFKDGIAQFPFGAGLNFRVSPYAFINVQAEFRKALVDDRDNIQIGLGYVYLLHVEAPKVVLPLDTDKDGTPDNLDKCPTLPGPPFALGCPDSDNDGVADAQDACPNDVGTAATLGCPDYDADGVADKDDDCPTAAGALKGCPDQDNDGVADKDDECLTEAGTLKGCPDKDFDGVADKNDKCPDQAGSVAFDGCPEITEKDSDSDGVLDAQDDCPTTAGTIKGCPDSDNDGVVDLNDKCPNEQGPASNMGCPLPKDTDNDGVTDEQDKCPNEAGPASNMGCPLPKDSDGDGVVDEKDKCPNEPGPLSNRGCPLPKDTDNDGVIDEKDKCPTEAGPASNNGCPLPKDSDKDGVTDDKDKCPTEAGPASNNGCPLPKDSDNDGINDDQDKCPTIAGTAANMGCPPPTAADSDGDGVADKVDRCPNTAGPASNSGCPEIKKETKDQLAVVTKAVQFETSKALLKNQSYDVLDELIGILRQYPDYTLSISGYTDDVGNDEKNLKLSQDRAKACYDYLLFKGIKQNRLRYAGFGEARPIASNNTVEGREMNRRVEFELILE